MQNCISLSVIWISHISSCTQSTFLPCLKFQMLPLHGSFKVMLYVTTTLHKTYVNLCFPSKMSYFSPALRNKIIPPHDAVKFSEFLSECWTSTISLMSTNTGSNITWTITKQSLWGTGPSREPFPWFTQHWDTFRALFSELLSVCYDNTKWKKKPLTHTRKIWCIPSNLHSESSNSCFLQIACEVLMFIVDWHLCMYPGGLCSVEHVYVLWMCPSCSCAAQKYKIHISGITYSYCRFFIRDVWF